MVAICHYKGLWEYYWVYSLYYTTHPMTYLFYSWKKCLKRVPGETRSFKTQKCQNGFNVSFKVKLYKVILSPHLFLVLHKEEKKKKTYFSHHNNWSVIYILLCSPKRRPGVNHIYNVEPNFVKVSFFPAWFFPYFTYGYSQNLFPTHPQAPKISPNRLSASILSVFFYPFCIFPFLPITLPFPIKIPLTSSRLFQISLWLLVQLTQLDG